MLTSVLMQKPTNHRAVDVCDTYIIAEGHCASLRAIEGAPTLAAAQRQLRALQDHEARCARTPRFSLYRRCDVRWID